jgi:hypothetical protein
VALDKDPAERALRGIAIGRKNYPFVDSDRGTERAAALDGLIESAKLNGFELEACRRDVLARTADHPSRQLAELLPS